MRERGDTPQVDKEKVRESLNEVFLQENDHWKEKIQKSRDAVVGAWLHVAELFESEGDFNFAEGIREYIDEMPDIKTERDAIQSASKKLSRTVVPRDSNDLER